MLSNELATIRSILPGIPSDPDKPTILLHHSPDGIQYASEKGVDLDLAGYTHTGQVFPVNFVGDLICQYNKGLNDYQGTHSEVTVITMKPE